MMHDFGGTRGAAKDSIFCKSFVQNGFHLRQILLRDSQSMSENVALLTRNGVIASRVSPIMSLWY